MLFTHCFAEGLALLSCSLPLAAGSNPAMDLDFHILRVRCAGLAVPGNYLNCVRRDGCCWPAAFANGFCSKRHWSCCTTSAKTHIHLMSSVETVDTVRMEVLEEFMRVVTGQKCDRVVVSQYP